MIKHVHGLSNGSAGSRSVAAMATTMGVKVSRYVATRVMKDLALTSCQMPKHRYKKTGEVRVDIDNHLAREFDTPKPNQVWCGDVTYIWTGRRWSYLAIVMDL